MTSPQSPAPLYNLRSLASENQGVAIVIKGGGEEGETYQEGSAELKPLIALLHAEKDIPELLSFRYRVAEWVEWADTKGQLQELGDIATRQIPNFGPHVR